MIEAALAGVLLGLFSGGGLVWLLMSRGYADATKRAIMAEDRLYGAWKTGEFVFPTRDAVDPESHNEPNDEPVVLGGVLESIVNEWESEESQAVIRGAFADLRRQGFEDGAIYNKYLRGDIEGVPQPGPDQEAV